MIGKNIIELLQVDSTNSYCNRMFATSGFEDGVVVWAHEQQAGRGQQDHDWISEAGKNLTFTVCLKPYFLAPARQFQLNKAISLGVLDYIRSILHPASTIPHLEPTIKWPNDLYIGNRKVGGILIENKIMGSIFETSIAGIGLNINQTRFSPEIPNPVSLIHHLGHETVVKETLISLCGFLDGRYQTIRQSGQHDLDVEFDENLLGFGRWGNFLSDGAQVEFRIKGVDSFGRLLAESRTGEIRCFGHREIAYMVEP